jgi:hypothetical protein
MSTTRIEREQKRDNARTYDSPTSRLVVGQIRRDLTIRGEVFVLPTRIGYAPAIHVEASDGSMHHLLLGASSLALPIEEHRISRGGELDGIRFSVSREHSGQTAKYLVEFPGGQNANSNT